MKKLLLALVFISILTSCAFHRGSISSSSINRSVKYEDIAYGVAQTNKYFGLGGLSQDALVLEAKRDLIRNRPLKPSEEYANFTVDFKNTFLFFYNQTKVTLSADVVKFTNDSTSDPYSEKYKQKLLGKTLSNDLFCIGDSILYDCSKDGVILSVEDIDEVRILYKTKNDKIRTKKISINDIYTKSKSYKEYKVGDRYIYSVSVSGKEQQTSGKILGVGLNSLIIRDNLKNIQIIKLDK